MEQRRILIRAGRPPHQPVPLEAAHAYRGVGTISTNPGNLLFQDAVYRTLATPDTHLVVDSLSTERRGMTRAHIARINDEFDVFVVPLANAFRDDFVQPLRRLTDVIEQLNIPVVVTGVGGSCRWTATRPLPAARWTKPRSPSCAPCSSARSLSAFAET